MTKPIRINTNATALVFLPPAPSPSSHLIINDVHGVAVLLFPEAPILDSAFDLATLSVVSCLILLSILSLSLIFHLRLKSRRSPHLQKFNALWSVRLLLVSFVTLWSLNESLRLPFFHRRYIYPFLLSLPISEQANLCKIHVVLSLGFFEPGFLITLLFLLNLSIKKRGTHDRRAIALIFFSCLPIFLLQIFFVFFSPMEARLPNSFHTSSILFIDDFDRKTLICAYPFLSTWIFAAFAIAYSLVLLFAYWRVISLVINKGTTVRIHVLALTVLVALPMQVGFRGFSSYWRPTKPAYGGAVMGMFVSASLCFAVGAGILVIKPTADAIACGEDSFQGNFSGRILPAEVGGPEVVAVVDGSR